MSAEWVTPLQAVRMVAGYSEAGGEYGARRRLLAWIAEDHVHVRAIETTRWLYTPKDQPHAVERTYGPNEVQPLGIPILRQALPLTAEVERNYTLTSDDLHKATYDPDLEWDQMFSDSQLAYRLLGEHNPNSHVLFAGLRFSKPDIQLRIEIAGWEAPQIDLGAVPAPVAAPISPAPVRSPKSRPVSHDHAYAAAMAALKLAALPKGERVRLTGPSTGRTMQEYYASRHPEQRVPHEDNLDDFGASVLEALREHWGRAE